ncbi:MAG: VanW family protein [Patescibacteria group bacterium]|jgi:vancomycin resistance protein YoaR
MPDKKKKEEGHPEEKKNKKPAKKPYFKIALILIAAFFIVSGILLVAYYYWDQKNENKIYPNVYINEQNVGRKTFLEALEQQDAFKEEIYQKGLTFIYQEDSFTVPSAMVKDEASGISVDIVTIDTNATVDAAYKIGRSGDRQHNFFERIKLLFQPTHVVLSYTLNNEELIDILDEHFGQYENPAKNAKLTFDENGAIVVEDEKEGQAFDWEKAIAKIQSNIENNTNETIYLNLETDLPLVKKSETDDLVQEVETLLKSAPLTLTWEDKKYTVERDALQLWLVFSKNSVALDEEAVTAYFQENISEDIDQPVKEGKFSLNIKEDETVELTQFQEGEDGTEVKLKKTIEKIQENWIDNNQTEIELAVEVVKPKVAPSNIADLGIKELLGTGYTNFSGSPSNRIYNIKKGADILNGLLIAPGETFSLINALGHIDGESGWLPELVIKENKTIPEYGGGLCQIGTTSFRAAMMSGLDIIERQNHSYVVSYYNYNGKPGVDATIYEPKPDFRFLNDTGHYILWRSRIEGADIYFEFWGTADGRKGYFTDPTNYNYVGAPPPVITEVDDLPAGVLSCSEKAHTGVSASFDYIIERPDGDKDIETFTSVYKALPQVCQKGRETSSDTGSTNTNVNTNSNTNTAPVNTNTEKTNKNTNKNKKQSP